MACQYGYVYAVAPAEHQSGKSSSITIDQPLRAYTVEKTDRYTLIKVNGTPTDCAKLSFNCLLPRRPDIVLSGINHGYNAGNSVIYSGTMGVVFEGLFQDIPSVGFSYSEFSEDADFSACVPVMKSVIEYVLANGLPHGVGLNVNIRKVEEFEKRVDPFGRDYYWITGRFENTDADNPNADLYQLQRGFASITPCAAEQTHQPTIQLLREKMQAGKLILK